LSTNSYWGPDYGGSVIWSSTPDGLSGSGSGGTFTFNPNASTPTSYVVTARSTLLTNCYDTCTVNVVKVDIEADLKDQPPTGKTYASGINTNSIVLKLNGTQVTPTITDITDGKHVHYKPACSELNIPGNNTVELKVRDNANAGVALGGDVNDAGNETATAPVSWSFTLP
jgi:hypothetical protein